MSATCSQCGTRAPAPSHFCGFCGALITQPWTDTTQAVARRNMTPIIVLTAVAGFFGLLAAAGVAAWWMGWFVAPWSAAAGPGAPVQGQPAAASPVAAVPEAPTVVPPAPVTVPPPPVTRTIPPAPAPAPAPTTAPTTRAAGSGADRPGSQWPAYSYAGPVNLCTTGTFPEPALIKVGSGFKPATQSAEYALIALGYDGVDGDGVFESGDAAALTRFQGNHGLIADGTLGQQSWTRLRAQLLAYGKC